MHSTILEGSVDCVHHLATLLGVTGKLAGLCGEGGIQDVAEQLDQTALGGKHRVVTCNPASAPFGFGRDLTSGALFLHLKNGRGWWVLSVCPLRLFIIFL